MLDQLMMNVVYSGLFDFDSVPSLEVIQTKKKSKKLLS